MELFVVLAHSRTTGGSFFKTGFGCGQPLFVEWRDSAYWPGLFTNSIDDVPIDASSDTTPLRPCCDGTHGQCARHQNTVTRYLRLCHRPTGWRGDGRMVRRFCGSRVPLEAGFLFAWSGGNTLCHSLLGFSEELERRGSS